MNTSPAYNTSLCKIHDTLYAHNNGQWEAPMPVTLITTVIITHVHVLR